MYIESLVARLSNLWPTQFGGGLLLAKSNPSDLPKSLMFLRPCSTVGAGRFGLIARKANLSLFLSLLKGMYSTWKYFEP